MAGLIKAVLALKHRELPPSLHYEQPNPEIDFTATPFYVNAALKAWDRVHDQPRRAGVSSFGLGGTNAHAVLEEAPDVPASGPSRDWHVLPISARSQTALDAAADGLAAALRTPPDSLADVAYTLSVGRHQFDHRRIVVCASAGDGAESLAKREPLRVFTGRADRRAAVAFLFPGQGSQYVGMARELYDHEPAFRATVDDCAARLGPHLEVDVREAIFADNDAAGAASERLKQTGVAQSALFVVEYALADLLMSWGIRPDGDDRAQHR